MPQMYCLKTIHALDCRVTPEAQRPLHSFQPAPITQRSQRKPQVDVGLVQPRLGKMRPQERHVELAAVESDNQGELPDVGGELVEVDSFDKQGYLAAAQRAKLQISSQLLKLARVVNK